MQSVNRGNWRTRAYEPRVFGSVLKNNRSETYAHCVIPFPNLPSRHGRTRQTILGPVKERIKIVSVVRKNTLCCFIDREITSGTYGYERILTTVKWPLKSRANTRAA